MYLYEKYKRDMNLRTKSLKQKHAYLYFTELLRNEVFFPFEMLKFEDI